jgi:hypothetical protein
VFLTRYFSGQQIFWHNACVTRNTSGKVVKRLQYFDPKLEMSKLLGKRISGQNEISSLHGCGLALPGSGYCSIMGLCERVNAFSRPLVFKIFFVRISPDVISLQLSAPKVVAI